jgi:hypothetical protein
MLYNDPCGCSASETDSDKATDGLEAKTNQLHPPPLLRPYVLNLKFPFTALQPHLGQHAAKDVTNETEHTRQAK